MFCIGAKIHIVPSCWKSAEILTILLSCDNFCILGCFVQIFVIGSPMKLHSLTKNKNKEFKFHHFHFIISRFFEVLRKFQWIFINGHFQWLPFKFANRRGFRDSVRKRVYFFRGNTFAIFFYTFIEFHTW